jgi:hypothetical protein
MSRLIILICTFLGFALTLGCASDPETNAKYQRCADAGANFTWAYGCHIDGYSMYPWREQFEQEKLQCVRAGGVPMRSDRDHEYYAGCPNNASVRCRYDIPKVTCNAKSVVVY